MKCHALVAFALSATIAGRPAAHAQAPGPAPKELSKGVRVVVVASGFDKPLGLEVAPGDRERFFVVEQGGTIRIARAPKMGKWSVDPQPFLDISARVSRGSEQGLLGLAFHPLFATNRKLYVDYTDKQGATHVVEYRVRADDPNRVDPSSAVEVFTVKQPFSNHNGGYLEFGPDGKLYVGTGDGGAAGDPMRAAQNPKNLLGKLLRFDVAKLPTRAKVVAVGLRNPWRFHFDRATGDAYIADVGQNKWEEVNVAPKGKLVGKNFGWSEVEGKHCYRSGCDRSKYAAPVIEYDHDTGCSITGGIVYRGRALPALVGSYFYSDFCTAILRSFRWTKDGVRDHWDWKDAVDRKRELAAISAFGSDHDGELYLLSLSGSIFRLEPAR